MRIVGGKYKSLRFSPPKNFPSRPTTDFAKEALFNILENRVDFEDCDVLDLFAGTGNISAEFLSRGAAHVLSIDDHPVSCKFLSQLQKQLADQSWKILRKDAFQYLENTQETFDIIFADPPYALKSIQTIPEIVFNRSLLKKGGMLIVEHGKENNFSEVRGFTEERNYGGVRFSFFELS